MFEQSTHERAARQIELELEQAAHELESESHLLPGEWGQFGKYIGQITDLLMKRVSTNEEVLQRVRDLAKLFQGMSPSIAATFYDILTEPPRVRRREGDTDIANLFHRKLHPATHKRLLKILRDKF